jgi:hypothetical protein
MFLSDICGLVSMGSPYGPIDSVLVEVFFHVYFCLLSRGEPNIETAGNNSCIITIVGYHGISVYQVVALIPDWVT